jgi:tRNA(Ile)-lysidine synthase
VRATLCGAKIIADDDIVLIVRDAGETARGGLARMALPAGEAAVWDGRFELIADRPGLVAGPLAGWAARLSSAEQRALAAVPAPVRPALPAVFEPGGAVTCPILAGGAVRARDLVHGRTRAACGAISKEPAT